MLLFTAVSPGAYAIEAPKLSAEAVVIADMESGIILYEKNMSKDRSPASLTKIMTGLLAVEAIENGLVAENDVITASDNCLNGLDVESSTANPAIQPGEQLRYIDVLYCALLHSANEACNVLAETIAGNLGDFVDKMNYRARELGAENTRFFDTNGLLPDNTTTAYDLYLITKEAMKHPLFATIVNTESYKVPATNVTPEQRVLFNSNALLTTGSDYGPQYRYEGVSGVKTGYTKAAGYCLVSTCQKNGMNLLCIVMGCTGWLNTRDETYGNFADSIKLYDWAYDNFEHRTLVTQGDSFGTVSVEHAAEGETATLTASQTVRYVLPKETGSEDIKLKIVKNEEKLKAPISAGDEIGDLGIFINDTYYGSVKLISGNDVKAERSHEIRTKILEVLNRGPVKLILIILVAAIAAYILIRISYKKARKKHLASRARAEEKRRAEKAARDAEVARSRQQARSWKEFMPSENEIKQINQIDPSQRKPVETDLDDLIQSLGLGDDSKDGTKKG